MNAYDMFLEIRSNINESTADHWSDLEILRKMNLAQNFLYQKMAQSNGDWWVTSETISCTNSIGYLTYPDTAKLLYIEHATDGYEIPIINFRDKNSSYTVITGIDTGDVDAFFLGGNVLQINASGFNDSIKAYYQKRPAELSFGSAGTGSTTGVLVFDSTMYPNKSANHYQYANVWVEGSGADGRFEEQITVYNAPTDTATITKEAVVGDTYGTKTMLPTEAEPAIVLKATVLALSKPSSAIDPKYYEMFKNEYMEMMVELTQWLTDRRPGAHRVRVTTQED